MYRVPRYSQALPMVGEKENCCITLHQPWASLLVHGIKRIEGRSWSCPMRGRLWIHAASKIPEREIIEAMEEFYREAYVLDGVADIVFPEYYPTSVLLGFSRTMESKMEVQSFVSVMGWKPRCVDVVGCLYKEELENWDEISAGVRMEAQTEFCWLCENPQKLVIPLEMRGRQGLYNLQNKMLEVAPRALRPARGSAPVKFPSLDTSNLEPGCLRRGQNISGKSPTVKNPSPKLDASIAGARAAALQFRKQDERAKQQGSTEFSTFSSPDSANGQKTSFQYGKTFLDRIADRRERGKTLEDVSTPINASRQAPRRVPACRIFDRAMGALGPRVPRKDPALKSGGAEKDEAV